MERDDIFDTECFIDEVEKRVAIWDIECPDYSNRSVKRKKWEELINIFSNPGDSRDKKNVVGALLQKKWKGLRDGFVREMKKINCTPYGSEPISKNAYIYFNRLMFLERSVRDKITDCNIHTPCNESNVAEQDSGKGEGAMRPPSSQPRRRKKKINSADATFYGKRQKIIASDNDSLPINATDSDDDKLFCLSLHKELLKVPEVNRLQTKIEMLNVLKKGQLFITQNGSTEHTSRNTRRYKPAAGFSIRSATGITKSDHRDYLYDNSQYDPAPSLNPSTFNRSGYTTRTYMKRDAYDEGYNASSSSSASTVDLKKSECLKLFQD